MKRAIQHINTFLIIGWALGSAMWMGGESAGNPASPMFFGLVSFICSIVIGRELYKRNLLITEDDDDQNDKY